MTIREALSRFVAVFDPDRDWRNLDKLQHLVAGFILVLLFDAVLALGDAVLVTIWTLAVFEVGQIDTARDVRRLGTIGFGFGLLDLVFGLAGIALYGGLRALL